nr:unnamed protein product [Haemonchus contortus]
MCHLPLHHFRPLNGVDTEKIWKSHKYQEKLLEGDVGKRKFRILFFGINDKEEEEEEAREAERKAEELKREKEGKGGEKEVIERIKEKIVIQKEVVQAPQDDDLAGLKTCRQNVNFQQRPSEPAPKK